MEINVKNIPIEESVELDLNYPSVSDRYFTHYYFIPINPSKKTMVKNVECSSHNDPAGAVELKVYQDKFENVQLIRESTCIMRHSNRICVITLSPFHPVIAMKKKISKVDFKVDGIDRLLNKVSGKGKRGAQVVGPFSSICCITCTDNSVYVIYAGIPGKLIEVNERLVQNPNLITETAQAEGYLAVVLPKLNNKDIIKESLLKREQVKKLYLTNV